MNVLRCPFADAEGECELRHDQGMPCPVDPANYDERFWDVPMDSVALRRLVDEVRNDPPDRTAYNRVYHRHNR